MAILFRGERINETLGQHDESLRVHSSQLDDIRLALQEKVDRDVFDARVQQLDAASASRLEAAVLEREQQVSALWEKVRLLEEHTDSMAAVLQCKADTALLHSREEHLAGCIAALEKQHGELTSNVATKANEVRVEAQSQQLNVLQVRVRSLQSSQEQLATRVCKKADDVQLREQQERIESLAGTLQFHADELRAALATKASSEQHSKLGAALVDLQDKLSALDQGFHARLEQVRAALAKTADSDAMDRTSRRLEESREELSVLSRKQAAEVGQLRKALHGKPDKEQVAQQHRRHDQLLDTCALKEDVAWQLRRLQEQLDDVREQGVCFHEQLGAAVSTKLDHEQFREEWDTVIEKEIRPDIQAQRERLGEALVKEEQLILLAERMQADLGCALALRGRGPPRLGPLVTVQPAPSPRKLRALRAATPP